MNALIQATRSSLHCAFAGLTSRLPIMRILLACMKSRIHSDILVAAIKDILLRMNLSLSDCRGQCCDGGSNMTGSRNGVAAQLRQEETRAVLTHCYGHALNLAVEDTIKKSKVCCDAMDVGFEISKLIRFSPKRSAALERIKLEIGERDHTSSPSIRAFCPTRWTVRADAIDSILSNYSDLNKLCENALVQESLIQM